MKKKRCLACNLSFDVRPQVPHQSYCSAPGCQRTRRREWQRQKLKNDPDHRHNQQRAQKAWCQRNPDYWRQYRESHPEYVERNRIKQRERRARDSVLAVAKMNVSAPKFPLPSGKYQMRLVTDDAVAKMDVWTVEITAYACRCLPLSELQR
jgi:hypothetical protein